MGNVKEILKQNGPLPSSRIKEILMKTGLGDEAAKQRISRTRGTVKRLQTIRLPNREQFLYLNDQFATDAYWSSLIKTHTEANTAYGIAFQSIVGRGGVAKEEQFHILSGAPKKLSKHTGSTHVLERLIDSKLLIRTSDPDLGDLIQVDGQGYLNFQPTQIKKARLLSERIILNGLKDWIRKLGLGSYNKVETILDGKIPSYGQFDFDLVSPSYIYPLVEKTRTSANPGFVVSDVIYQTLEKSHIQYFIKKCRINRQLKKMRPFLGILVSERFSTEAFDFGKKEGLILTTPEIIFGQEIADALKDLVNTLEQAAAFATTNPDKITQLFSSLSKLEGAENNVKGALFELIVGHVVLNLYGTSIDIGVKVVAPDGKMAEIDVRRVKGNHEVAVYECKSRPPKHEMSLNEVKMWFSERVPIIRKALLNEQRFQDMHMTFEYWTTGEYSSEALHFLEELKGSVKKYSIDWKNGKEVLKATKNAKTKSMIDVLKNHYLTDIWQS